jgi:hypothetical protein
MSYAPQTLLEAREYLLDRTGLSGNAVGIVGDASHTYGYHLGKDRLKPGDYSATLARDKAGLSNAASALDVGNFAKLVALTAFLVAEAKAGRAPDIREVIGPKADGRAYRWDFADGEVTQRAKGDSHEWHVHISYYRDSEHRDKVSLFKRFFEGTSGDPAPSKPSVPNSSDNSNWLVKIIKTLPTIRDNSAPTWAKKRAQSLLASQGYPPANTFDASGRPDGIWGDGSVAALKRFQAAKKVKNSVLANGQGDGELGRWSWTALVGV